MNCNGIYKMGFFGAAALVFVFQAEDGIRDTSVTGVQTCALPISYVFNATVVPAGFLGYLTLWPQGSVQPLASTLNAYDGAVTSNMAVVPTSNTEISAFATSNTYLILDISGYFAP